MANPRRRGLRFIRWARKLRPAKRAKSDMRRKILDFGIAKLRYLLLVPLMLACITLAAWFRVPRAIEYRYQPSLDMLVNPLCGLAIDATIDPVQIDGEYSLVYAHATWRELEPEEGIYAFDAFEERNHLSEWREKGARLILRLSLDDPGIEGHADIPDWLLDATGDGAYYTCSQGAGYSPDYSNLTLQEAHGKLLAALAERYDKSGLLAYIEIGSLGQRGEWTTETESDVPALPMMDSAAVYIWQYFASFTDTPILARRPYREAMLLDGGVYNPRLNEEEDTWKWLDLLAFGGWDDQIGVELRPQEDYGLTTPSGAGVQDAEALCEMLRSQPETLLRLAMESRCSYLYGAFETARADIQAQEALEALAGSIGYRFWIRQAEWPWSVRTDYSLYINLTVRNDGCAAMSASWPVEISLWRDGVMAYAETVEANPGDWLPGDTDLRVRITIPKSMVSGEYELAIAILDPATGEPAVQMATDTESHGLHYLMGKVTIKQ